MTGTDEELNELVEKVLEHAPDASAEEVKTEFERYRDEFLIPPKDAMRSVLRKFEVAEEEVETAARSALSSGARAGRRVDRFEELDAKDMNVTIEVSVVTYTPRVQMVRGEERQIAYGWIEDNPWGDSGDRVRWDFKDWGNHAENLAPGSVVRLEGTSVNEWQGRRSLNINQSSRVVVLREGGPAVSLATSDPISISDAGAKEGFVTIVGRVISRRDEVISKRDGSGDLPVVKGRLADETGSLGFICWTEFEHEPGTLLRIEGASVRRFRDNPELNISDRTKVEVFIDNNFASSEQLATTSMLSIGDLLDGARDVSLIAQLNSWSSREFTNADGEQRTVWGGDLLDPSGRCRVSAWCELPIDTANLPMFVRFDGVRVRSWQGTPDITVDEPEQVSILDEAPWEMIDAEQHWVEYTLHELTSSGSKRGIETSGTIVAVRGDCGIIQRCPECRRVLRDGACAEHGDMPGERDLRLRFVLDDGISCASLLLNRESSEALLGKSMEEVVEVFDRDGAETFVNQMREQWFGRSVVMRGRAIVDEQGAMLMADQLELDTTPVQQRSEKVREQWGVIA